MLTCLSSFISKPSVSMRFTLTFSLAVWESLRPVLQNLLLLIITESQQVEVTDLHKSCRQFEEVQDRITSHSLLATHCWWGPDLTVKMFHKQVFFTNRHPALFWFTPQTMTRWVQQQNKQLFRTWKVFRFRTWKVGSELEAHVYVIIFFLWTWVSVWFYDCCKHSTTPSFADASSIPIKADGNAVWFTEHQWIWNGISSRLMRKTTAQTCTEFGCTELGQRAQWDKITLPCLHQWLDGKCVIWGKHFTWFAQLCEGRGKHQKWAQGYALTSLCWDEWQFWELAPLSFSCRCSQKTFPLPKGGVQWLL